LGGEVEGDLLEVVGDDGAAGHVDDGRHGDAARIVGEPGEVGLLEPLVAEHGVDSALVEVEGPGALAMGGGGHAHGQGGLEAEQAAGDEGAVGPGARACRDEPVAARLDGPAVTAVAGDAVVDVVHVAVEGLPDRDIGAAGGVLLGGGGGGRVLGGHLVVPSARSARCAPGRSAMRGSAARWSAVRWSASHRN